MRLTLQERLILYNQARILEIIDSDFADGYKSQQTILMDGYSYLYDHLVENFTDEAEELSKAECDQIIGFLSMFRAIKYSINRIDDMTGLNQSMLEFDGFDGNEETKYYSFTKFFCTEFDGKRFEELWEGTHEFNSHSRRFDRYSLMHEIWQESADPQNLTKEDLLRIQNA